MTPFGLINAPASFQVYINNTLTKKLDICVIVYLNDIIIYSKTPKQHNKNVLWILEKLSLYKLYIARNKCQFKTNSIDFVGFLVSSRRIQMQNNKLDAIRNWSKPTIVVHIMQFIDFANFYKRFIRNFFKLTTSFIEMLKDSSYLRTRKRRRKNSSPYSNEKNVEAFFTPAANKTFKALQQVFITALVLRHFNSIKQCKVKIDAFDKAVDVIFCQQNDEGH